VTESPSLLSKLEEAEEQNRQLKETKAQLEKKLFECQKDNEELHKWLDRFGDRTTVAEE
jgi:predicted RNase H-like nuclease (RuvC/YqgF family)